MPKPPERRAYLVSVSQKREAVRVYAVLAVTSDEAPAAVAPDVSPQARVEIVDGLSLDLVKRLRLKIGELRLVRGAISSIGDEARVGEWAIGYAPTIPWLSATVLTIPIAAAAARS